MSVINTYASILNMDSRSFSNQIASMRKTGRIGKKWIERICQTSLKTGRDLSFILSELRLNTSTETVEIGKFKLTKYEYKRQINHNEWCWSRYLQDGHLSYRWTCGLILSPIFPLGKKIEVFNSWVNSSDYQPYYDETDMIHMLSVIYLYAFDEWSDFSQLNPLLSEVVSTQSRIQAAKKANKEISVTSTAPAS